MISVWFHLRLINTDGAYSTPNSRAMFLFYCRNNSCSNEESRSNNIDSLQVRIKIDTSNIGGANSGLLIDSTVWLILSNSTRWALKLYTYNVPIPVNMSYYKEYNITAELILNEI